ncbi:MAG: hypothetical protein M3T49_01485 [Candidatus Eremiobacteraeota bacterium]|nr:hypothetical protein [Candidatus Eremiobacteraeota bacterium]
MHSKAPSVSGARLQLRLVGAVLVIALWGQMQTLPAVAEPSSVESVSAFALGDVPQPVVDTSAHAVHKLLPNGRLERAGEAAIDVARVLAELAGNKAQVGSMPFVTDVAPEVSFVRLRRDLPVLVIATVVEPEVSLKHLKTATVISWVQPDGSIAPLWHQARAYGPDTIASARIVRFDSAVLRAGATTADLILAQTRLSGEAQVQIYRLASKSLNRVGADL